MSQTFVWDHYTITGKHVRMEFSTVRPFINVTSYDMDGVVIGVLPEFLAEILYNQFIKPDNRKDGDSNGGNLDLKEGDQ